MALIMMRLEDDTIVNAAAALGFYRAATGSGPCARTGGAGRGGGASSMAAVFAATHRSWLINRPVEIALGCCRCSFSAADSACALQYKGAPGGRLVSPIYSASWRCLSRPSLSACPPPPRRLCAE